MDVLIVANPGSFSADLTAYLSRHMSVKCMYPMSDEEVDFILTDIAASHYDRVLIISGETRIAERMMQHNFEIPARIIDQANKQRTDIIYLSSLAVFGYCTKDTVNIFTQKNPLDRYGQTKLKLDLYVDIVRNKGGRVTAILPASIHSGRGRSSVEKAENMYRKLRFLKYVAFPGVLSFVYRENLIASIYEQVARPSRGNIIISEDYKLDSLAGPVSLKIPRIPQLVFTVLEKIVSLSIVYKIRVIFRGISYK